MKLHCEFAMAVQVYRLTRACRAADVLQRVSPYLNKASPIDILDLWPNAGLLSSTIHNYLRPRRHLLVEPDLACYKPWLQRLVDSDPSYKLISEEIYTRRDWAEVFEAHLPEQVSSHQKQIAGQSLPRNDTLLILASPPVPAQKADHYTPQRWWSAMMESCMQQRGVHKYGSVRILASLPPGEVEGILPRTVAERRRPALLTETVASRAFEVAGCYEEEDSWVTIKPLEVTLKGRERVAERASVHQVVVPAGREAPPLKLAPVSLKHDRSEVPHSPRIFTGRHQTLLDDIEAGNQGDPKTPITKSPAKTARQKAQMALHKENAISHSRHELARLEIEVDQASQTLSRAAADPTKTTEELEQLDHHIGARKTALTDQLASLHHRLYKSWDRLVDDYRTMNASNNFDESVLLYDRRPSEPLLIDRFELFPREPRTIVYFEPDANPEFLNKLSHLSKEQRQHIEGLFEALSSVFGPRNHITVGELLKILFLERPSNDIIKAVPTLAPFAIKRLKPGHGAVPLADPTVDSNTVFQENLNYDVSDVRLRCIPSGVMWDILLEYQKHAPDITAIQFSRMIGGTLTSFRAGRNLMVVPKRMH
jgi:transcription factor 1